MSVQYTYIETERDHFSVNLSHEAGQAFEKFNIRSVTIMDDDRLIGRATITTFSMVLLLA